MKFLFEFLPIIVFFVVFQIAGIYVATAVAMLTAVLQIVWFWLKHRRIETMHWITLALITVFGGATLLLHDPIFIKWKPTAVNWVFAIAFWLTPYIGNRKPLLERLLSKQIELPPMIWKRLNWAWICFFIVTGFINIIVVYNFSTTTWVYFKLFGLLGLMVLFIIAQSIYLSRWMRTSHHKD